MNKKLILLILVLPLFLLLSIYTSTNTVGLNIKVPVSKIEVTDNKIVYLDLDSEEKHFVKYAIYPIAASNKDVAFTYEQVGSQRLAELEYKDGYIIPKSVGAAKVYLTTIDGGFKDSFIVQVESVSLQAIECSVSTTELMVGNSTKIQTVFVPDNISNKTLRYVSSDESVATVSEKGIIRGVGKGSAVIFISSELNPEIVDTINVNVYNENIMDLGQSEIYTWLDNGSFSISVDTTENYQLTYKVYDANNELLTQPVFIEEENGQTKTGITSSKPHAFNYMFKEDFIGTVIVKITITTDNEARQPFERSCIIHKVDELSASYDFEDDKILSYTAGQIIDLHNEISVTPENADVHYEVEISNNNIETVDVSDRIRLSATLPGVTTVNVKVVSNTLPGQTFDLRAVEIVVLPTSIDILESAKTFGIENIWTIGQYEANGDNNTSKLTVGAGKTQAGENFFENIYFTTTQAGKVEVDKTGVIKIEDSNFVGLVDVTCHFNYQGITCSPSQPYTIRCVGNGVNIRCFEDLYSATNQKQVVVLQAEIKDDFGKYKNGNAVYTEQTIENTKITSTYDITHYKNLAKQKNPSLSEEELWNIAKEQAKVKVLLSFREDIYGNGYEINAHNVAYGLDSTGKLKTNALFQGPLNFVSMSESQSSLVSVKAQDNICFAVYEEVNINNVVLKSCDLQADKQGNYDLTDLTYVGTTVEVFGDNVNINYSRLTNGRTVLRVFGDIEDSQKVINLNINNCVLSGSREFIIRMGSNAFVTGTKDAPAPYLLDDQTKTFPMQKSYENMTEQEKLDYESSFIKTFVKIKNSVLKDSGLFCIGMDSHFAGTALADGSGFAGGLVASWYDLAKTSFGAKLTFEGDVRIYDWKDIDKIDSSTLIEIIGDTRYSSLKFEVKELIKELANNTEKPILNRIVYTQDGKQYAHGGIAFFGGGKNYSVFETKDYDFYLLNGYEVKLSDVGKTELQLAAGNEAFYFMLNDSNTHGFLPDDQAEMLNSDKAYAPIYKKD